MGNKISNGEQRLTLCSPVRILQQLKKPSYKGRPQPTENFLDDCLICQILSSWEDVVGARCGCMPHKPRKTPNCNEFGKWLALISNGGQRLTLCPPYEFRNNCKSRCYLTWLQLRLRLPPPSHPPSGCYPYR